MKEISLDQTSQLFGTKSNPVLPQQITIKDGNLTSNFEYLSLATLCSLKNPKIIFEIGTFEGYSTKILSMNAPKATIYTLDLPPNSTKTIYEIGELNERYTPIKKKINFLISKDTHKIKRLFGDSAIYDFSKFNNKIDFVFIDGAHTYEYTKNDTERALDMINDNGVIVWHDYNPSYWPETVKFIKEFSKKYNLYHIKDTYLVFLIKN